MFACSIYKHQAHWQLQNFTVSAHAVHTLQSGNISRDMLMIFGVVVLIFSWNCKLLLHPSFKGVFYSNWAIQLFVWSPSRLNTWSLPGLVMKICLNRGLIFSFYWPYNPRWVSVCSTILFHPCLPSTFALQPTIFILFRSSSTWSIHLNLGLPTGLVLCGVHSVIFLVVFVFSILITWAAHLSLCDFINFIISSCFILSVSSSFVLILCVPSGFCVGP